MKIFDKMFDENTVKACGNIFYLFTETLHTRFDILFSVAWKILEFYSEILNPPIFPSISLYKVIIPQFYSKEWSIHIIRLFNVNIVPVTCYFNKGRTRSLWKQYYLEYYTQNTKYQLVKVTFLSVTLLPL